jgi:hypothetical protein
MQQGSGLISIPLNDKLVFNGIMTYAWLGAAYQQPSGRCVW